MFSLAINFGGHNSEIRMDNLREGQAVAHSEDGSDDLAVHIHMSLVHPPAGVSMFNLLEYAGWEHGLKCREGMGTIPVQRLCSILNMWESWAVHDCISVSRRPHTHCEVAVDRQMTMVIQAMLEVKFFGRELKVPNILTLMLLDEVTMNIDCSKWLDMVVNCEVVSVGTLIVRMVVVGLQYMESMQCSEGADNLMPTTVLVTQSGGGHVMVTQSGGGHVMVILSGVSCLGT